MDDSEYLRRDNGEYLDLSDDGGEWTPASDEWPHWSAYLGMTLLLGLVLFAALSMFGVQ